MGCQVTAEKRRRGDQLPVRSGPHRSGSGGRRRSIEVLYGDSSFYGGKNTGARSGFRRGILRRDLQFKSSTATTKTLERRGMFEPVTLPSWRAGSAVPPPPAS
jgi:hypothetical protein